MSVHRFRVLDGMRGIAAFTVMDRHAGVGFGIPVCAEHGYLAVDFFFMLSGFVLAYAYERQIAGGMSFGTFARLRFVRLYPMIFAAGVLGAVCFSPGWPGKTAELAVLNTADFVLLPLGLLFHLATFPVNIPLWSLFFECCANGVYFSAARLPEREVTKAVVYLAATGLILAVIAHWATQLGAVGVNSGVAFLAGFPRVAFSFGAGVLMFRFSVHRRFPAVPDYVPAGVLTLLLVMPACGWWYDVLCVLLVFPVLLGLGSQAVESHGLSRFWLLCGALSYPVYVVHEPVLRGVFRLAGAGSAQGYWAMTLAVALAYALLRWYDEPVRAALAARLQLAKA
ncbi:acyltransferase family protein [Acidocella aromatica]|uniref:Peptidoglycan/LPS O-acetylase OafA/YrhL n=1 Tax=Acidocella aromatica TaxID=1303579 RepID=A0A840VTG8_9PROT|nr:acyltransferase [Acidocella aromatica]MBB5373512.1 peptidoglycan/LPS O-acetylase OafA/YrhL [Acidocella aromatica]